jgi:sulfate permease family protein
MGAARRPSSRPPARRCCTGWSGSPSSFPATAAAPCGGICWPGVTVAALALPSAMAYAELAGLSPVSGLYALLLPAVAYTLLGSSQRLIIGP